MTNFQALAQGQSPGVMPWGKHKGKPLSEVPRDYLMWALKNASSMTPELRGEIERMLGVMPGIVTPETSEGDANDGPLQQRLASLRELLTDARKKQADAEREVRQLRAQLDQADRPTDLDRFRRILKQWFGAMSRRFHPDLGGSAEKQVVVNVCYQDLMRRLEEICPQTQSSPARPSRSGAPW